MKPAKNWDLIELLMLGACLLAFLFAFALGSIAEAQTRNEIEAAILEAAERHEIEPDLALAIAEVESSFNPNAVGGLGEIGIFQLRPEYHRVIPGDIRGNAEVAMQYLAQLKTQCSHYGEAFYICWNLGPNYRRLKHPTLFPYFKKVQKIRQQIAAQ